MSSLSNSFLACEIVSMIRNSMLEMMKECDDCDPWTEEQDGCNWIDNELSLFLDLYNKIEPVEIEITCDTVKEAQEYLERQNTVVLNYFYKFCLLGGTSNSDFFNLRTTDASASEIKQYLDK